MSKKARGGQLAIASKMASKAKAGSEALKVKVVDAKVKGKKLQRAVNSSENSELEASEDEVSSEDRFFLHLAGHDEKVWR